MADNNINNNADTNINIIEDETLHARITIPLTSQISGPPEVFSQNTITNILKRTSPKDLHQHMLAQWKESEVPAAILEAAEAKILAGEASAVAVAVAVAAAAAEEEKAATAEKEEKAAAADTGNENNRYGESKQGEEIDSTSKDKHTEEGKKAISGKKEKEKRKRKRNGDNDNDDDSDEGGGAAAEKRNKNNKD